MKRGVAASRRAEQSITVAVHPLRARLDPAVANPRRISDDDVEAALRYHMREVDIVGKEIKLALLGAVQKLPRLDDARVQLATASEIRRTHAAEEVLLRRGDLLQLALVDVDRLVQKLRRD